MCIIYATNVCLGFYTSHSRGMLRKPHSFLRELMDAAGKVVTGFGGVVIEMLPMHQ